MSSDTSSSRPLWYGLFLSLALATAPTVVKAQTYTILYSFNGSNNLHAGQGLARDQQGNLYGASGVGGDLSACDGAGCGAIYKVDPSGNLTIVYQFKGSPDGAGPNTPTLDAAGNIYGTTQAGGLNPPSCGGCGTVFKISQAGQETILHNFQGPPTDGESPSVGVVLDSKGDIFGSTSLGGSTGLLGDGTVYTVSPGGHERVLYNFLGGVDGGAPISQVILNSRQRSLYGVAATGGGASCYCGTVWDLSGSGETIFHSFTNGNDGGTPANALLQGGGDTFYGTTDAGGDLLCTLAASGSKMQTVQGCGTVWRMNFGAPFATIHVFTGMADGSFPASAILRDAQGNLYGSTEYGGDPVCNCGIVFKIDRSNQLTALHTFTGSDGRYPGNLIWDGAGNLAGTANFGPDGENGSVVFKLSIK